MTLPARAVVQLTVPFVLRRDPASGIWTVRFRIDGQRFHRSTGARDETEARMLAERIVTTARRQRRLRAHGWVYFIRAGDAIKIGWSSNPTKRLAEVRCGNPNEATLLAVVAGTGTDEFVLHKRFASYGIRGEWFEASEEILAYIAGLPTP